MSAKGNTRGAGKATSPAEERRTGDLLAMLVDDEVIAILKQRLTPQMVADLVMERINPYRPLETKQKALLGGVAERTVRDRESRGE